MLQCLEQHKASTFSRWQRVASLIDDDDEHRHFVLTNTWSNRRAGDEKAIIDFVLACHQLRECELSLNSNMDEPFLNYPTSTSCPKTACSTWTGSLSPSGLLHGSRSSARFF